MKDERQLELDSNDSGKLVVKSPDTVEYEQPGAGGTPPHHN